MTKNKVRGGKKFIRKGHPSLKKKLKQQGKKKAGKEKFHKKKLTSKVAQPASANGAPKTPCFLGQFASKRALAAARFKPMSAAERSQTLQEASWQKLKTTKFRQVNEALYTMTGTAARKMLQMNPDAFDHYHEGYRQQVEAWPVNPLDVIIESIRSMLVLEWSEK
jgi:hypothetical protein